MKVCSLVALTYVSGILKDSVLRMNVHARAEVQLSTKPPHSRLSIYASQSTE